MKKFLALCLCLSAGIAFAAEKTAAVKKTAAAAKTAAVNVKFTPPRLANPKSWTMVVVPDVQTYIKQIENHGIMDMMMVTLLRYRETLNIQQVLFTGDLVFFNDTGRVLKTVHPANDLIHDEQWKAFSRLMERLDNKLPYILCLGNHDYGWRSSENRQTFFPNYFPPERNKLIRKQLIECYTNPYGVKSLERAAYEFQAPSPDNRKFLVITLPFAPIDEDLAWAKKLADKPQYANHFGIVLTHSYMMARGDNRRIPAEDYALNKLGGNAGEQIFQKLVRPAKNLRLVVCGHVGGAKGWGVAFTTDKNSSGKTVGQLVFNTQFVGGRVDGNGGDGWLRFLEFMPDKKTIKATTYSALFSSSPATRHMAWRTDDRNDFSFVLE